VQSGDVPTAAEDPSRRRAEGRGYRVVTAGPGSGSPFRPHTGKILRYPTGPIAGVNLPRPRVSAVGAVVECSYLIWAASFTTSSSSDASSFFGVLTRLEIGHIRIGSAGKR
jgi:hypothetical protein